MKSFLLSILITFSLGATVHASAVDVPSAVNAEPQPDQEETQAEYQARVQTTLRSLTEKQAAGNRVRSFSIKVVDQNGQPVQGALIGGFAKRFLRIMLPSGKLFDGIDIRAVTDAQGRAQTPPTEGAVFELSIYGHELPKEFDAETSEGVTFEGGTPSEFDLRPVAGKPRQAPGIDWIFYVHRFIGPRPLVSGGAELDIPSFEGSNFSWTVLHPLYADPEGTKELSGPVEEVVGPIADFRIRFWRDPQAEMSLEHPRKNPLRNGTLPRLINDDVSWWYEITCVRGGLQPYCRQTDPALSAQNVMAPETGYRDRVVVESKDGSTKLSYPDTTWFWWKRTGIPTRYALIGFNPLTRLDYETQRNLKVKMRASFMINPTPNDRLIERAIHRPPTWITQMKKDLATQWLAEPPGDQDPEIEHVAPREAP